MSNSKILNSEFMKSFIKTASRGSDRGWHEINGGNLSYRIKPEEIEFIKDELDFTKEFVPIGTSTAQLADEFFLVTGSGKYFCNIKDDPESNLAIIQIDKNGENYRICFGLKDGGVPTSELPTHLMNHQVKKMVSGGRHRIIYHGHTPNTIALTFVLPLDDRTFTRGLWESMMECLIVFPEGVGVLPFYVAGGVEIAQQTAKKMEKHNITIWAHHGTFCSAEDFDKAFGLMETIEKASEILVKVMSMSDKKMQTITSKDFADLAKNYNVEISDEFL